MVGRALNHGALVGTRAGIKPRSGGQALDGAALAAGIDKAEGRHRTVWPHGMLVGEGRVVVVHES